MYSQAIQILRCYIAINQGIEFINHQTNGIEFIFRIIQMYTDIFTYKYLPSLFISIGVTNTKQKSEIFTQILQKLSLGVKSYRSTSTNQHFYLITSIRI